MNLNEHQCRETLNIIWHRCPIGIAIVNKDGFFRFANPSFCDLVEYTELELMKLKFENITHPQDIEADVALADEVGNGIRKEYTMKKRYITKTGKVIWVMLRVCPCVVNNTFEYFISQISQVKVVEVPRNPAYGLHETIGIGSKILFWLKKYWVIITGVAVGAWTLLKELPELWK